jgi:hypothetical protein
MGMLDEARRLKKAAEAQRGDLSKKERIERAKDAIAEEDREKLESQFAEGAERVHVELIKTTKVPGDKLPALVTTYIGVLGLRPEETYGVWPTDINSETGVIRRLAIAHREQPEHAAARERFEGLLEEGF